MYASYAIRALLTVVVSIDSGMLSDLSMSQTEYNFVLGVFFVGYSLGELPSNFFLKAMGATNGSRGFVFRGGYVRRAWRLCERLVSFWRFGLR
ncbi:hypothetical protein M427DRAFT_133950 [Gonapodya prolifera JEL478]|uniref:Major facilitator superfamily (MFS) profile domain-containing protein n=1 Tax=Gonapodya prolifera (strain JEL478) TaxID=1344416 RepID=A0A139AIQ4_GONPJ|nr:hypothetical protein M427DRAFT_133950 [Gonapodya prolifera JEL478]|eukprot:KXS16589.1 hypothetical protein M427DRAFT_133950 [Gonapodya prolifera JEL478]